MIRLLPILRLNMDFILLVRFLWFYEADGARYWDGRQCLRMMQSPLSGDNGQVIEDTAVQEYGCKIPRTDHTVVQTFGSITGYHNGFPIFLTYTLLSSPINWTGTVAVGGVSKKTSMSVAEFSEKFSHQFRKLMFAFCIHHFRQENLIQTVRIGVLKVMRKSEVIPHISPDGW